MSTFTTNSNTSKLKIVVKTPLLRPKNNSSSWVVGAIYDITSSSYLHVKYVANTNVFYRQNHVDIFYIDVSASTSYNLTYYVKSTQNYSYAYVGPGSSSSSSLNYPSAKMIVYELETSSGGGGGSV